MKQKDGLSAKKIGISLVVVISMLISGIAILAAPVTIAQETMGGEYGGDLSVALQAKPSSLNPLASPLNDPAVKIIDLLYESLGRVDPYSLKMEPWMASDWEVNETDTSQVTVTLRNNIKWHDGTDVTLEDVVYSMETYNVDYINSMALNQTERSILFNLAQPDSRFFSEAMNLKIVPADFIATDAPMGCGPFMYTSMDDNTTVITAFDSHFMARPYLDSIEYSYYPFIEGEFSADYPYINEIKGDDPRWDGTYRAAYDLITGDIDFIGWGLSTNQTTLNVEVMGNYTTLILDANTSVQRSNGLNTWYLGFNNNESHILNNVALRKAISSAINKATLTQYDISGGLEQASSVMSKYNVPWYNSSIQPYEFDMGAAQNILDNAGIMNYNGTGYVMMPDGAGGGTEFSLTLLGPPQEDVTPYTMSTNVVTWFEQLGINVTLESNTTEVHNVGIEQGNYDMFLATQEVTSMDPQFLNDIYHSESTSNILNFAGQYNVDNESMISKINTEGYDIMLNYTNLVDVAVYHNLSLVADTEYNVSLETGAFTWANDTIQLDYANDTLNITYNYRPFDHFIELANGEMDQDERAVHVKDAQAVIADLCPTVPMFSYRVNHAYNATGVSGWVKTLGGIDNYWSYTNVKNELVGELVVTMSSFKNYLTESESMDLVIKVLDLDGAPIDDAQLVLTGDGTFTDQVYDADGEQYTVTYTAPASSISQTVNLAVTAYSSGYLSDSYSMDVTVHPAVSSFIVDISRGETSLDSGNITNITVSVMDKDTSEVIEGATVVLDLTPIGLGGQLDSLTGTTDAAGQFTTAFSSNNVTVDTTFRITAYVTMEGYTDADQSTSISVSRDPTIEVSTGNGFLGLPAPSFLVVLVMLASMSMIYAAYRRKD